VAAETDAAEGGGEQEAVMDVGEDLDWCAYYWCGRRGRFGDLQGGQQIDDRRTDTDPTCYHHPSTYYHSSFTTRPDVVLCIHLLYKSRCGRLNFSRNEAHHYHHPAIVCTCHYGRSKYAQMDGGSHCSDCIHILLLSFFRPIQLCMSFLFFTVVLWVAIAK
jgi:hypothetical protein